MRKHPQNQVTFNTVTAKRRRSSSRFARAPINDNRDTLDQGGEVKREASPRLEGVREGRRRKGKGVERMKKERIRESKGVYIPFFVNRRSLYPGVSRGAVADFDPNQLEKGGYGRSSDRTIVSE